MELSPEMMIHGFGFLFDIIDFVLLVIFILLAWKWKSDIMDRITEKFSKVSDKYRDDSHNDLSDIRNDVNRFAEQWTRLRHSSEGAATDDSDSEDGGWASGALDDLINRYPHSD